MRAPIRRARVSCGVVLPTTRRETWRSVCVVRRRYSDARERRARRRAFSSTARASRSAPTRSAGGRLVTRGDRRAPRAAAETRFVGVTVCGASVGCTAWAVRPLAPRRPRLPTSGSRGCSRRQGLRVAPSTRLGARGSPPLAAEKMAIRSSSLSPAATSAAPSSTACGVYRTAQRFPTLGRPRTPDDRRIDRAIAARGSAEPLGEHPYDLGS